MIDRDLQALAGTPAERPLGRLEADIWAGVGKRESARRTGRIISSCQALVLMAALLGSAAAGVVSSSARPAGGGTLALTSDRLAPSTLLLGTAQ